MNPSHLDNTTNDELARILLGRDSGSTPSNGHPGPDQRAPHPVLQAVPRPSAANAASADPWAVSEDERVALFAALRKGCRSHLGREPTVAEFMLVVGEVYRARNVAASAQEAMQGELSIHVQDGRLVFRG
jgi:hypothetical protein